MKNVVKLIGTLLFLSTFSVHAQVTLQNFSSVVDHNLNFFYGSWEVGGDTGGTKNPNSQFSQGSGVYNITGSTSTNSADSAIEFFNGSTPASIGTNTQLSVTAQILSGNAAPSFQVVLFDTGGGFASATFVTSLFNSGGYTTATVSLAQSSGFNMTSIDSLRISGAVGGGTDSFRISFDNISAVPEPATYAAILGAATLGFAYVRRRNRSQAITAASR